MTDHDATLPPAVCEPLPMLPEPSAGTARPEQGTLPRPARRGAPAARPRRDVRRRRLRGRGRPRPRGRGTR
ncbi:hypothetical protein ACU686_39510 [Yinghuangia aomiensis]